MFSVRSQGNILDRVIANDRDAFWTGIKYYISFSVAIALFGSVQSLCFALASRKMSTLVKNELYRAIIVQVSGAERRRATHAL